MAEIFLLEDDTILNKGISIALKRDEHNVTSVYGFTEAVGRMEDAGRYDIFLLDINLPDGSGMEFCRRLRELCETPVLFLTANDTEEEMLEGFAAGCDDYISKPFSLEVLRKKVQAVLKRSRREDSGIFRYKDLTVDMSRCLVAVGGEEIRLTMTEYRLLEYMIANRGHIVTRNMILENIWDIDGCFVDDNTVRVNIRRLRQKLHDSDQKYIVTVFGMGYTFGERHEKF